MKEAWIKEPSCSSLLFDSKLFVCKHIFGSMYPRSFPFRIDTIRPLGNPTRGISICSVRSGNCATKKSG